MSQMTAVLDQMSSSTTAASAAATAASDTVLAAVAAASRLAIFFPQTDLLTLTQTALSCVVLESGSDFSIGKQSCIAKLGLGLAEALISTWTEQKDGELQRGTVSEGEDWDEGSGAAWSDIIKGLLTMALVCRAAGGSGTETEADVLLLKALRKNHSLAYHRYLSFPLWGRRKGGGVGGIVW